MHGVPKQRRSCGKRRYPDHRSALDALHCLAVKSTRAVHPVRTYSCVHCKGWHLTSKPDRHRSLVAVAEFALNKQETQQWDTTSTPFALDARQ